MYEFRAKLKRDIITYDSKSQVSSCESVPKSKTYQYKNQFSDLFD